MEKPILSFLWDCTGPWIVKTIFKKKNEVGGLILLNFETYCKATVIKTIVF
jgi:hypothetical protein